MTYEQAMQRLGELEIEAQAAIDADRPISEANHAEVAALEALIETMPEFEALIERLSK